MYTNKPEEEKLLDASFSVRISLSQIRRQHSAAFFSLVAWKEENFGTSIAQGISLALGSGDGSLGNWK